MNAGNCFSTAASFLLGASMVPFFRNVFITARNGKKVQVDDPWGFGASLEWATSCPPPHHNFTSCRGSAPALEIRDRPNGTFIRAYVRQRRLKRLLKQQFRLS